MKSHDSRDGSNGFLSNVNKRHSQPDQRRLIKEQSQREKPQSCPEVKKVTPREKDNPGVIFEDAWKTYPWLRAGFSTSLGGASCVYGENDLNLGWTDADAPATVRSNRQSFVRAIAGDNDLKLVTVRQIHSNLIRDVSGSCELLATPDGKAVLRGDALMTNEPGLLLGIQTADCVPVLVADTRKRVVAAFHAGWRGTLARIVERGLGDFKLRHGSRAQDIVAAIGPCIGTCCFAVGEEVRSEFQSQFIYGDELFSELCTSERDHASKRPQIVLDLVEANRRQLLDAGLPAENITAIGECTACTNTPDGRRKYFSHRAEHGFTGRMMSVIGVAPE